VYTDSTLTGTGTASDPLSSIAVGGVSKIIAGSNITLDPATGLGDVTITATSAAPTLTAAQIAYGSVTNTVTSSANATLDGSGNITAATYKAANGTAVAPSHTFSADTTLGIYRDADGTMRITKNGDLIKFNNGIFYALAPFAGTNTKTFRLNYDVGAVATPSFTFNNDIDTGMWSSGADTLNFSTGGVDRLTLSSTGRATFTGIIMPQQAATASAPAYVNGAIYFDTTLNKLRVGGATGWETITSV